MSYYFNKDIGYIEGDRISPEDQSVPKRPTSDHEWTGSVWAIPPSVLQAKIIDRVQKYLDDTARTRGYDDIKTAVTYADEPAVPKFQAEGQALRAWRSLVWDYCYAQLSLVQAGQRSIPTPDEAVAELPVMVWPEEA